jgi:hypothetical protein
MAVWSEFIRDGDAVECVFLPGDVEPSPVQLATLRHVEEDQAAVRDAVVAAMRAYYDSQRPEYVRFATTCPTLMLDVDSTMPKRPDPDTFAQLHTLQLIYVHDVVRDGRAYVGFSFHALWEREHGLGVLVHGRSIVEIGPADTSFLEPSTAV